MHSTDRKPSVVVVASAQGTRGFDLALINALRQKALVDVINYRTPLDIRDDVDVVVNRAISPGQQHITDLYCFEQQTALLED